MSAAPDHDILRYDRHGAPYVIAGYVSSLDDAQRIARSAHPSRVLATKGVYRYGKFEERTDGSVTVTMMGSHIATYTTEGVHLWSRGHRTLSTSEALGTLALGRMAGHRNFVLYVGGEPLTEGQLFRYRTQASA